MKMNLNKFIIFVILVFIFIFKPNKAALSEDLSLVPLRPNVEYKSEELKDPFEPPEVEKKPEAEPEKQIMPEVKLITPPPVLKIEGLVWGGRFPQAIINQKVVKIGDIIEGAQIVDINREGVTFIFNNSQYNLPSQWILNNLESGNNKQNFLEEGKYEK